MRVGRKTRLASLAGSIHAIICVEFRLCYLLRC